MKTKNPPSNYDLQVDIGKKLFMEYDQEMLIRRFGSDRRRDLDLSGLISTLHIGSAGKPDRYWKTSQKISGENVGATTL